MHVALLVSSLAGGGAERAASEMANYWVRHSWDVTVLTWTRAGDPEVYGVDAAVQRVYLGLASASAGLLPRLCNNARRIGMLRRVLYALKPDIVLSFMDTNNVAAIIATRGTGIPVVVAERSDPAANTMTNHVWRTLRRVTYRWADAAVAQTRMAADWISERCGVSCAVVPNSLRMLPIPNAGAPRDQTVLSVGRLSAEKDVGTLLRAFAGARRAGPSWRLVIVGDGPQRPVLEAMATSLGVAEYVTFVGFVNQPEQLMERAGIYVLTSRFEGFPNALLEAMAMGACVISSDCRSGPGEMIRDGINGRLFRPGDADDLTAILSELMRSDGLRRSFGAQAMQIRGQFAPEQIMPRWESVLRGAIERKRA
jgi:GalNAc-alpha-(1->4)-GalNAc-alpha-(1->3)-diNAcBac-PP-undecaprenol alpha-1,4-N-acetyl-D-galactosaminyltransferase